MTNVEKTLKNLNAEQFLQREKNDNDLEQDFNEALEDYFRRAALTQRAPLPRWAVW
ncbi:hypothetical protein [Candidatus Nucleicultrix amoebiphila]|jgi:hypothetical protein|uniref:hypothetical protein n=1 Tax=Candidatus Nucleicultrix amoebiphila TaxID=1509244 RepID=UPI0012F4DC2D|nr:hypothetical protein [Candidatus Nucleicultrix amoebiphila]